MKPPKATDVLAAWAAQQQQRDYALLRLSVAMLMQRLDVREITLSSDEMVRAAAMGPIDAQIQPDQSIRFQLQG